VSLATHRFANRDVLARSFLLLSSARQQPRTGLQCGVHEESFLFCLDPVVVLEFQWRLYQFDQEHKDELEPLFQKWDTFSPTQVGQNSKYTDYLALD